MAIASDIACMFWCKFFGCFSCKYGWQRTMRLKFNLVRLWPFIDFTGCHATPLLVWREYCVTSKKWLQWRLNCNVLFHSVTEYLILSWSYFWDQDVFFLHQVLLKTDSSWLMRGESSREKPTIPCFLLFVIHVQQQELGGFTLPSDLYKWTKMRYKIMRNFLHQEKICLSPENGRKSVNRVDKYCIHIIWSLLSKMHIEALRSVN